MWLGICLSAVGNFFLAAACFSDKKERLYLFQCFECLFLAAASVCFRAFGGVAVMLVCALRNYLIFARKMNGFWLVLTLILTVGLGIFCNNLGWIGLFPVLASVQLTLCGKLIEGERGNKIALFFNLFFWSVYGFLIGDFPTGVVNGLLCLFMPLSLLKSFVKKRKKARQTAVFVL
ncbi:MAG: YgjV family protein [Clostridia bacterium]|nr:YgjV family protein [Clostridia bacterium]